MRYRRLDANGDFVMGQGANNFFYGIDAVVQAIKTRLTLLKGTFWRDVNDGLPLYQQILGQSAGAEALKAIDAVICNRITGTPGVTSLLNYGSTFDHRNRAYTYQATVQTAFSTATISGTI